MPTPTPCLVALRRTLPVLCALVVSLFFATFAFAAESTKTYDIKSGPAATTLKQFAEQSGRSVLFSTEKVQGISTNAISGELTTEEALDRLLSGTRLSAVPEKSTGGFAIRREVSVEVAEKNDSSRPANSRAADDVQDGVVKLDTFEVFGRKTLNMDIVRSENDPLHFVVINAAAIEKSGATNLEDFLKERLTMNTVSQTYSQLEPGPNGATNGATSSVNLRGLGANATLILIDGRRSAGSASTASNLSGATGQVDINGIPLSAIERIEVLPSSASAIYGGAALGGVVNVVLKRNFSGGELRYNNEDTWHGSAMRQAVSAAYGRSVNGGATQIMVGGQYATSTPLILRDRRALYEQGIQTILTNSPSFLYSLTNVPPGASPNIRSITTANLVLRDGTPLNSRITFVPTGAGPTTSLTSDLLANAGSYNLQLAPGVGAGGLDRQIGINPTVTSGYVTIRQNVWRNTQIFLELSTNHNEADGLFGGGDVVLVSSTAPTNPFRQNVQVRLPTAEALHLTSRSQTDRAALGLVAPLGKDWNLELDYTISRNVFARKSQLVDTTAFSAAINAGTINPFIDTILFPPNLSPYIGTQTAGFSTRLNDASLRLSGALHSRIQCNLSVGHREEKLEQGYNTRMLPVTTSNNLRQLTLPQLQATDSAYLETRLAVLQPEDRWPWLRSVDINIAGRTERFRTDNGPSVYYLEPATLAASNPPNVHKKVVYTANNPTVALKVESGYGFVLRGSFGTGFLPPAPALLLPDPTLRDSFGRTIFDPKHGQTYAFQSYTAGGNPNLQPQRSRSWNYGAIWEPKMAGLNGFRISVNFYEITQPNYITLPSFQDVLNDPAFSSRVTRDPTTDLVTVIDVGPLNATKFSTSGIDAALEYSRTTSWGKIELRLEGTRIFHDYHQYNIGAAAVDYVGVPSEGGVAELKAVSSVSLKTRRWELNLSSNYISSYLQSGGPGTPSALSTGVSTFYTAPQGALNVPSQVYHNISFLWKFSTDAKTPTWLQHVIRGTTLQVGVKNIFNKAPPFDAFYRSYYISPFGDPRLRQISFSARKEF